MEKVTEYDKAGNISYKVTYDGDKTHNEIYKDGNKHYCYTIINHEWFGLNINWISSLKIINFIHPMKNSLKNGPNIDFRYDQNIKALKQ